MPTSILEQIRQYHEDIETYEKVASRLLIEKEKRKPKYRAIYDHAIQDTLLRIQDATRRVLELYADRDNLRAEEVAILGGVQRYSNPGVQQQPAWMANGMTTHPQTPPATDGLAGVQGYMPSMNVLSDGTAYGYGSQDPATYGVAGGLQAHAPQVLLDDGRILWENFYDQLKTVKDHHRLQEVTGETDPAQMQETVKDTTALAAEALERINITKVFQTDESLGQRVDMQSHFLAYTNLSKLRHHRESTFIALETNRIKKKYAARKAVEMKCAVAPSQEVSGSSSDSTTSAESVAAKTSSQTPSNSRTKKEDLDEKEEEEIRQLRFQEYDYIGYLKIFDDFRSIPRYCKYRDTAYMQYICDLLAYLQDFVRRLNPLTNHYELENHLKKHFASLWSQKSIPEWEVPTRLMPFYALPTDRIFTSAGVYNSHMQGQKYKKALTQLQALPIEEQQKRADLSENHDRSIAEKEFMIQRYKDILSAVFIRTIEHFQKKQSRTLRELQLLAAEEDSDLEEDQNALAIVKEPTKAAETDSDEEEDEKPVYNPLNLPLGWDGKPIPFWLYKLHGLGVEYKCEICGNYSYWGRRAFERHFQEWRHAFGMRCLKIPNTVHFKEITKIEDALLLYEQLKKEADLQSFKADQDVECEDAEGNVMSARAYEDLRRQGLL